MAVIQGDADQPLAAEQVSDLLVETRGSIPPAPAVIEPKILTAAKGSSIVFASAVIVQALRFAKGFVLARLLASQEYGKYRLALTVATITASLVVLGLESALVRYVALFASRRDRAGLRGVIQIGVGLPVGLGVLAGIGLFALAPFIGERLFHDRALIPSLKAVAVAVPFLTLIGVASAATRGFGKMQYTAMANICRALLALVLVVGVGLVTGLSAVAALIAFDLAVIATAIVLLFFLNKLFPLLRRAGKARRRPKELLKFALPVYASDLLGTAGPQVRTIALGALNTTASVGVFAVASQVNTVGQLFHTSLVTASMPIVSELHGQGAREPLKRFYQTVTKWTFTLNVPLVLIIVLFPAAILSIFGESYVGGAAALTILAWANLINTGTGICGVVIDMTGNTRLKLLNTVVTLVLTISLSLLWIPQWGVNGAAVATLAAIAIANLLRLGQVYVLFGMLPYRRDFFKPVVAGLVAGAAVFGFGHLWPGERDLIELAVGSVILCALYAGMLLLLRLSEEDRLVLRVFARRVTRRKPGRNRTGQDRHKWDQDSSSLWE